MELLSRRFFLILSGFAAGLIHGGWTHGTPAGGGSGQNVIDDLGTLVVDDLGNQVTN